jgi:hypothetical protein
MTDPLPAPSPTFAQLWAGRVIGGLPALLLLLDGGLKIVPPDFVRKATTELGYAESVIVPLGVVLTGCTLCYLFRRTSVLGAILLTGYLGGAVDVHVRAGHGMGQILFPVLFASLLWLGLLLTEPRLRPLLPWRR